MYRVIVIQTKGGYMRLLIQGDDQGHLIVKKPYHLDKAKLLRSITGRRWNPTDTESHNSASQTVTVLTGTQPSIRTGPPRKEGLK